MTRNAPQEFRFSHNVGLALPVFIEPQIGSSWLSIASMLPLIWSGREGIDGILLRMSYQALEHDGARLPSPASRRSEGLVQ